MSRKVTRGSLRSSPRCASNCAKWAAPGLVGRDLRQLHDLAWRAIRSKKRMMIHGPLVPQRWSPGTQLRRVAIRPTSAAARLAVSAFVVASAIWLLGSRQPRAMAKGVRLALRAAMP